MSRPGKLFLPCTSRAADAAGEGTTKHKDSSAFTRFEIESRKVEENQPGYKATESEVVNYTPSFPVSKAALSSSPATAPTQAQDEAEPCDEDEKSVMEDEEEKEKKP